MKLLSTLLGAVVFSALTGCSDTKKDFDSCSNSSTGENRSGQMIKCMQEKKYKLDGNRGTQDVFDVTKWKKSDD